MDSSTDGDVASDLMRGVANTLDDSGDPFTGAVGHVETDDIDATGDKLTEFFLGFSGRPDGGYDFCVSVVAAHFIFRIFRRGWFAMGV